MATKFEKLVYSAAKSQGALVTAKEAAGIAEGILSGIIESIKAGERFPLEGIGTLRAGKLKAREAREGKSVLTGKAVTIPALPERVVVKLKGAQLG